MMSPSTHSPRSTSDGLAQAGSVNQPGPSMPNQPRISLTGPVAGLNTKTNAIVAATGGMRAGR